MAQTDPMESSVTVTRTSLKDVKVRQMIVKVDHEPFGTLMYGQTATREAAPGQHRLSVDNTWAWKTVEFKLAPGEHIKFHLINRLGRFTWWMGPLFGAAPMYITIDREL